jgi:hypothetical protein
MGRVTELFRGNDGKIRSVKLVRPDRSEGTYSINLLYPLELSLSSVSPEGGGGPQEADNDKRRTSQRPNRAAAARCRAKLRHCN